MKPDPILASETLVKYILYLNMTFAISVFFVEDFGFFTEIIILSNILLLLLRQGIKKSADSIIARSHMYG